jgi:hypothetical protein
MAEIHAVRSSHGSQLFGLEFGDVIQPHALDTDPRGKEGVKDNVQIKA